MAATNFFTMDKTKLSRITLYGFFIVSIINLFEQIIKIGWVDLASKPLLMITLLSYYLSSRFAPSNTLSRLIVGALVFSWLGDVLLMLQDTIGGVFVFGLAAFLIAHIFYIFAYQQAKTPETGEANKSFVHTRLAFLIFIGVALIYMLYPTLGELLIPVIIYTIVIITMAIFALLRRGATIDKSFIMVYSGALLFIMSDSMIAINKFMSPIIQHRLLIMSTYIAAQFLIVKGILAHEKAMENNEETSAT